MIISASRRTDIPAFHGRWLLHRLEEKEVIVPNPRNPHRASIISLHPDQVDALVCLTKNPEPMLPLIAPIIAMGYRLFFHFTLTPYGRDLEPGLPPKNRLTDTFLRLAQILGPEHLLWRYDPIVLDDNHPPAYHEEHFAALAERLHGAASRCVISFVDAYRHLKGQFAPPRSVNRLALVEKLAALGNNYNLRLTACAEGEDWSSVGVAKAPCIDAGELETLTGRKLSRRKDSGQRKSCACAVSVDIGVYNSCAHGCTYCYANTSVSTLARNLAASAPDHKTLCNAIRPDAIHTQRTIPPKQYPLT